MVDKTDYAIWATWTPAPTEPLAALLEAVAVNNWQEAKTIRAAILARVGKLPAFIRDGIPGQGYSDAARAWKYAARPPEQDAVPDAYTISDHAEFVEAVKEWRTALDRNTALMAAHEAELAEQAAGATIIDQAEERRIRLLLDQIQVHAKAASRTNSRLGEVFAENSIFSVGNASIADSLFAIIDLVRLLTEKGE